MRFPGALIVVLILGLAVSAQATIVCRLCGLPISGEYIKFDNGNVYCADCLKKYQRCDICGEPSPGLAFADDKRVCGICSGKLPRCGICGGLIADQYTRYPETNINICRRCMKVMPKCDICGKPDKNLISIGGQNICGNCAKNVQICRICGKPISGAFFCFDGDTSRKYCQSCSDKYSQCPNCGAPVGRRAVILADSRSLCPDCYQTALFQPQQVTTIKNQVLDYLASALGLKLIHKVNYSLQGKDFIAAKSAGMAGDLNGLFYRKNDEYDIYVFYGLRQNDLYQVLAHEIAHAWMSQNGRPDPTLEDAEGFAQWAAYNALGYFALDRQRQILLSGNDIYAAGLKHMLELESRGGKQAVIEYAIRR